MHKKYLKLALSLTAIIFFMTTSKVKACSPYATPTLISQSISGGNLVLNWNSFTAWTECTYSVFVQVTCIDKPFVANGDSSSWDYGNNEGYFVLNSPLPYLFISPPITKSVNVQLYPQQQLISLSNLCPGKIYKFRAMEVGDGDYTPGVSVTGSLWTPTFTFMVPGTFVPPAILPVPIQTVYCSVQPATITANLSNTCGIGTTTYSWSPPIALNCYTCQTVLATPSINTTYTVVASGGPMSCWTASQTVQVVLQNSTAIITTSVMQAGCTNSVNTVTLTTAGSASVVNSIVWSPAPNSLSGNSLVATGLPIGITTITIVDLNGCVHTRTVSILGVPPPITFTVNNLSGTYSISCLTNSVNLGAVSNYTFGTLTYSWTSPSFSANTTTVSILQANTITVTAIDPATGCTATTVVTVGTNTIPPTTTVTPASQSISCISSPITFTGIATSPTNNIQHNWYSPINPLPGGVPIATSNNSITLLAGIIPPGVYTLVTTNLVNGCSTVKTVTVLSLSAFPTYSISSPTNFSVGCSPLHQTTISIINPVSTQTPPATCSYTFLPPSFVGVVTPSIVLGGNTSTVTTIPGSWTVIVQDNSNFCRTLITIPIIQNTLAPNVSATVFTHTLTCKNPTVLGTGTSTTPNTVVNWGVPSNPPLLSTPTVEIGPVTGPNTSTTSLSYANYTVIATNTVNACQTTSVITIFQNFKPPISSPTISIATPTAIYCTAATAPVVLTTGNSTTTSGGGALAFVANPCWAGPSPQTPTCGPSSYSAYVAGIYSLNIEDNYNGCKSTGTINVLDKTQPPIITNPISSSTLDCASQTATLNFGFSDPMTSIRCLFIYYPHGTAFNSSLAINPPGISTSSVSVDKKGRYFYTATNTLTGCKATGTFEVKPGALFADFSADKETGYPPLLVNFTNNTNSGSSGTLSGTQGITSVWNFGNGSTKTTSITTGITTEYPSPGTYTVVLYASKGSCSDTAYKIIKVELPSKLNVPNIFTPNGDGSNDAFIVHAASLSNIQALIFDRWGNKVYETNSSTGNILWDGKSLKGNECSDGLYFYIITATGFDDKEYKVKGNVTLLR